MNYNFLKRGSGTRKVFFVLGITLGVALVVKLSPVVIPHFKAYKQKSISQMSAKYEDIEKYQLIDDLWLDLFRKSAQNGNHHYYLAVFADVFGSHAKALEHLDKLIESGETPAMAYWKRANVHYQLGNFNNAMWDYDAAIKRYPGFGEAYYNRGLAGLARGDFFSGTAREDMKQAARMGVNEARIWLAAQGDDHDE